jgi:hypothetical protein
VRWKGALGLLSEGGIEEGERGHAACWARSVCWARWPLGRGKEKGKIEIYFEIDFQL